MTGCYILVVTTVPAPSKPIISEHNVILHPTSIEFSWTQLLGDVVDNYTVEHTAVLRNCDLAPQSSMSILSGIERTAVISGIEENSEVLIVLTASNAGGSAQLIYPTMTLTDGV